MNLVCNMQLEIAHLKLLQQFPGANELVIMKWFPVLEIQTYSQISNIKQTLVGN